MALFATPLTPAERQRMEDLIRQKAKLRERLSKEPLTDAERAELGQQLDEVKMLLFPQLYGKTDGSL